MDTSGTSGAADGSSGVVSGTGDFGPDCSMCNAEVDPEPCVMDSGSGDCGDDPNVIVLPSGACMCAEGYDWCSTDPDDLTCCEV